MRVNSQKNWRIEGEIRKGFEELIFTELWLERIKEIYITTYQSDTSTNWEQIKFWLLEKSNLDQSLAYTVFSLIKFVGINWRKVYDLQKHL